MENKKICPECKEQYELTRSDQKYCGATCRWNAWRKRQKGKKEAKPENGLAGTSVPEQKKEEATKDLFTSLRGVPEIKPIQTNEIEPKVQSEPLAMPKIEEQKQIGPVETRAYKEAIAEKQRVDTFGKRVLSDLKDCDTGIKDLQTSIEKVSRHSRQPKSRIRNWDVDAEDLFGGEILSREFDYAYQLHKLGEELKERENRKTALLKELDQANHEMNSVLIRLKTIQQFEKPKTPEKKTSLSEILRGIQSKKEKEIRLEAKEEVKILPKQIETIKEEPVESNVLEEENAFEEEINPNNSKLVSSRELRKRKYNCFPFTGKWRDFFGEPSYTFHLAVHGKPGEGKSTFCVQFADYLAKNFGRVVYVSGEEGLSKTVQDKIINNGIDNPYLFFADIKSYDEIKTEIPNEYNFIFIDSLDTLRIDAIRLKELKEHYPQSAFITISQSTKDGKMRGSLEIVHDTDIAAKVENGVAITTKNRFQARGTEFKVFDKVDNHTRINKLRGIM